jgi:hypothetical protein
MRRIAKAFIAAAIILGGCSAAPDGLMRSALEKQSAAPADAASPVTATASPAPDGTAAAAEAMDLCLLDPGESARKICDALVGAGPEASTDPVRIDTPQGGSFWLVMADPAAVRAGMDGNDPATRPAGAATRPAASTQPGDGMTYVPWRKRQGPAYPGNFWYSFGRWGKEMPETLLDDTVATFTNPWALAGLAAAGAAGITLSASQLDNHVEEFYTKHGSQLNSFWDSVGDAGGNPGTHFAVAGAMYFTSLARDDKTNYDKATTLFNALIINDLTVLALEGIVHTRSPNGDPLGWPRGHTSSSFTLATVIWQEYGPLPGVPLMAFAGYVGYERIDARNHDFSDVISGAMIGAAIGYAVTQNHMPRIMGFDLAPYVDPESGAAGVAATKRW